MPRANIDYSVYLVLDPVLTEKLGMVETARLAVEGGASVVQLRAPQWKKRPQKSFDSLSRPPHYR